jgi:hypothetical protein
MVQSLQCVLYLLNLLIIKNLNKAGKLIVMFLVRGAVVVQKADSSSHRARPLNWKRQAAAGKGLCLSGYR